MKRLEAWPLTPLLRHEVVATPVFVAMLRDAMEIGNGRLPLRLSMRAEFFSRTRGRAEGGALKLRRRQLKGRMALDEVAGTLCLRVHQHVVRGALFVNLPFVQEEDAVGHVVGEAELVGDDDHG